MLSANRFTATGTTANTATAYVLPAVVVYCTTGTPTVDFTLRFGGPQFELSSVATSPILPLVGAPGVTTRALQAQPNIIVQAAAKLSTETATVWDPTTVLDPVATLLTDGNRTIVGPPSAGSFDGAMGTVFQSVGKLYAEFTANALFDYGNCFGVAAPGADYRDLG